MSQPTIASSLIFSPRIICTLTSEVLCAKLDYQSIVAPLSAVNSQLFEFFPNENKPANVSMLEKSGILLHPRRKVLHALASSIAGSRNHGSRFFRRDFWPVANRRVPSNDPRINCGTHFGSSFLLVFLFRAEFSCIY